MKSTVSDLTNRSRDDELKATAVGTPVMHQVSSEDSVVHADGLRKVQAMSLAFGMRLLRNQGREHG